MQTHLTDEDDGSDEFSLKETPSNEIELPSENSYSDKSNNISSSSKSSNSRMGYNYVNIIVECILSNPNKRVLLSDIYKYVQINHHDLVEKGIDWQNGIRHNLSLNDCFFKDGRNPNGKGYYWSITKQNMKYFTQGDFRRRWTQSRTRRQRCKSEIGNCHDINIPMFLQSPTNSKIIQSAQYQTPFMYRSPLTQQMSNPIFSNDQKICNLPGSRFIGIDYREVFEQHGPLNVCHSFDISNRVYNQSSPMLGFNQQYCFTDVPNNKKEVPAESKHSSYSMDYILNKL